MDFGDFNEADLITFLICSFDYSKAEIQEALELLKEQALIIQNKKKISGISLKEVETTIDHLMKQLGWKYP